MQPPRCFLFQQAILKDWKVRSKITDAKHLTWIFCFLVYTYAVGSWDLDHERRLWRGKFLFDSLSLQRYFKRVYTGKEKGSPRSPNCECKEAICLPKIKSFFFLLKWQPSEEKKTTITALLSPAIEGIDLILFFKIISMHLSGMLLSGGEGFIILQRYSYEFVGNPGVPPKGALGSMFFKGYVLASFGHFIQWDFTNGVACLV